MRRNVGVLAALVLILAACGGAEPAGSDGGNDGAAVAPSDDAGGAAASGDVVDQQPPGQGIAKVDGLEYSFDTPGGLDCRVAADDFSFSYIIGDNQVTLGGGASISGGQWFGSLSLRIFEDNDVTEYAARLIDNPDGIAVNGNSVSYSSPFEVFAPNPDGGPREPEDVGNGTISATCG